MNNKISHTGKSLGASKPATRSNAGPVTKVDAGRQYVNPLDYEDHPWPSRRAFAELLTLRHDCNRTRHCYYRDLRLVHEWLGSDPALATEARLRDHLLHVRSVKQCMPKTIRQIKYLGRYVGLGVLADSRLAGVDEAAVTVTFTWKDRADHGRIKRETLPGAAFVKRSLRHVLPRGMRSIRYFGFCHPAAKAKRERVAFHSGIPLHVGPAPEPPPPAAPRRCPCCGGGMKFQGKLQATWMPLTRPPPEPRPAAASP